MICLGLDYETFAGSNATKLGVNTVFRSWGIDLIKQKHEFRSTPRAKAAFSLKWIII